MIKKILSNQVFLFLLVGGFAAGCNFFSRIIFNQWFSYSTSIVLAYLIGMLVAFVLNKFIVFKDSSQTLNKSILFFSLINLLAVLQTWSVSLLLKAIILPKLGLENHIDEIAHAFGVVFPVITSYIGHKKFSFKKNSGNLPAG